MYLLEVIFHKKIFTDEDTQCILTALKSKKFEDRGYGEKHHEDTKNVNVNIDSLNDMTDEELDEQIKKANEILGKKGY